MTTPNRQTAGHVLVVWAAFSLITIPLASLVPAWTVTLCVPAAGLVTWLYLDRRARRDSIHLERLAVSIDRLGALSDPSVPGVGPGDDAADRAHIARLESLVSTHHARIEEYMIRAVEASAALRANLDAIDAPVLATDDSGRITLLNRSAERLFSFRRARTVGVRLEDLLTSSALLDLHGRAERGEACTRRLPLILDGSPRIHEVAAFPARLGAADVVSPAAQRSGVVLTIKDVHELAQTLQLRTDFAANASHELRTPIASLRAALETMRGPARDDPEMQDRVMVMLENNVARLEEMVSDLLDLSNLEAESQTLCLESFDVREMTAALESMFDSACRKRGLTIGLDIDPRLTRLRTDRKLLLLILRNLIDNATKFAFEETEIRLALSLVGDQPDQPGGNPLPGVRFTIADKGVGIPLKDQERVFERFYQVDESRARVGTRRGSGLGLSIVRNALRRLGGEITVESVWQEGTTITAEIPRCVEINTVSPPERDTD